MAGERILPNALIERPSWGVRDARYVAQNPKRELISLMPYTRVRLSVAGLLFFGKLT